MHSEGQEGRRATRICRGAFGSIPLEQDPHGWKYLMPLGMLSLRTDYAFIIRTKGVDMRLGSVWHRKGCDSERVRRTEREPLGRKPQATGAPHDTRPPASMGVRVWEW